MVEINLKDQLVATIWELSQGNHTKTKIGVFCSKDEFGEKIRSDAQIKHQQEFLEGSTYKNRDFTQRSYTSEDGSIVIVIFYTIMTLKGYFLEEEEIKTCQKLH